MFRNLIAIGSSLLLCACVTVGGDPVVQSMQPVVVPAPCEPVGAPTTTAPRPSLGDAHVQSALTSPAENTQARGDLESLCGALRRAAATGSSYMYFGRRLDQVQAGLGLTQLASVTALVGFDRFDAHEDNISAATIIGALATASRSGLRPQARRDIVRLGAGAMNCLAVEGGDFLMPLLRTEELQRLVNLSAAASLAADTRLQALTSLAPEPAAQLEASLTALNEAINAAAEAIGVRRGAAARVNATHRTIETRLTELLSQQIPDFDAVATLIRERSAPAPVAPTPPADENALKTQFLLQNDEAGRLFSALQQTGRTNPTPAQAAEELRQLTRAIIHVTAYLQRSSAGPGQAELDEIATCANLN